MGYFFIFDFNKYFVLISYSLINFVYGFICSFVLDLMKIVNDICLLVSGLCSGIGELMILVNELGSFIMLGKVNFI